MAAIDRQLPLPPPYAPMPFDSQKSEAVQRRSIEPKRDGGERPRPGPIADQREGGGYPPTCACLARAREERVAFRTSVPSGRAVRRCVPGGKLCNR